MKINIETSSCHEKTEFEEKNFYDLVFDIVERIPEGMVTTYGDIAKAIGRPKCARTVGYAVAKAPKDKNLPCHRVVNRLGEMAPEHVFGGREYQRFLLMKEDVEFNNKGCVNMPKHLWKP